MKSNDSTVSIVYFVFNMLDFSYLFNLLIKLSYNNVFSLEEIIRLFKSKCDYHGKVL